MLSSVHEHTPGKPALSSKPNLVAGSRVGYRNPAGSPKNNKRRGASESDDEQNRKVTQPIKAGQGDFHTDRMRNFEENRQKATTAFEHHLKANLRGLVAAAVPSDDSSSNEDEGATGGETAATKQHRKPAKTETQRVPSEAEAAHDGPPLKIEAVIVDGRRVSLSQLTMGQRVQLVSRVNPVLPSKPLLCTLHVLLKVLAVVSYMFGSMVVSQVVAFLATFGLLVLDFWVNKNITGRKLVGLRWWNDTTDENGFPLLTFESYDVDLNFPLADATLFWWAMAVSAGYWGFMFLGRIFSLDLLWGALTFIGMFLSWSNLWGYFKCHRAHRQKLGLGVSGGEALAKNLLLQKLI